MSDQAAPVAGHARAMHAVHAAKHGQPCAQQMEWTLNRHSSAGVNAAAALSRARRASRGQRCAGVSTARCHDRTGGTTPGCSSDDTVAASDFAGADLGGGGMVGAAGSEGRVAWARGVRRRCGVEGGSGAGLQGPQRGAGGGLARTGRRRGGGALPNSTPSSRMRWALGFRRWAGC